MGGRQHLMKNGSCIIHYSGHEHRFCIHFAMLQSFSLDCAPFGIHTYTLCSYNTNCYHIFVKGDWAVQLLANRCQNNDIVWNSNWKYINVNFYSDKPTLAQRILVTFEGKLKLLFLQTFLKTILSDQYKEYTMQI